MHNNIPRSFIFLDQYNSQIFKNNNTNIGIIYRNYNDPKREKELTKVAKACKKNRYQFFVANDIKLALKVRADGIYIPAFNKTKRFYNLEKKNFTIIGSAHNQKEIQEKMEIYYKMSFNSGYWKLCCGKTQDDDDDQFPWKPN